MREMNAGMRSQMVTFEKLIKLKARKLGTRQTERVTIFKMHGYGNGGYQYSEIYRLNTRQSRNR